MSSIGQDLLYHVNSGRKQTSKHTTLSFLIKRKTGSKQLITWTNKFGHGISYDEVLILETSMAMEHSQHQVHRSFTPSIIQPSTFVTFVWDNNDINPESLKGVTMHCTNGIIVQLSSARNDSQSPSPTFPATSSPKPKKKSFQPMTNEMPSYMHIKRKNTDTEVDVRLNVHQQEREISHIIDTIWVIVRSQASKSFVQQTIPNWTGFNYLMCENECESFHRIGYLPAINQSPTSHDTVLELLIQSKLKAEKLGLAETDVVLDMAIYSKAVEILMNPKYVDLKRFIVLRLGAFHIMCIYIAVIGKRFGDAGLRDIVVESNILGESSVDKMLKGKHYNNAMRVLKYLFDAIKRQSIDSYEEWIKERSVTTNHRYAELLESTELQNVVRSPGQNTLQTIYETHSETIHEIQDFEMSLLNGQFGPTASFWASFLQMVQTLFDFMRSIKLGNWKLHMQSTEEMLAWMFAYD